MARGLRILQAFHPRPDSWALGWYQRALGELEAAYQANTQPQFRADIRLLQGRLPEVAAQGDDIRTATARFLMGETTTLPPSGLACAVPRIQLLLYLGRLDKAQAGSEMSGLYRAMGLEGDRARCQLFLAEAARRQADLASCDRYLAEASAWIFHSGSMEHLCLLHLCRAQAACDRGDSPGAQRAVEEGLHLAVECGLGLYHIELLCAQARCLSLAGPSPEAERRLREALDRALDPHYRFLWGAAEATMSLGHLLINRQRRREARGLLKKALALQRRIGHPRAGQTAELLARLS